MTAPAPKVPFLCIDPKKGIVTRYSQRIVVTTSGLVAQPDVWVAEIAAEFLPALGTPESLAALEDFRTGRITV